MLYCQIVYHLLLREEAFSPVMPHLEDQGVGYLFPGPYE